MPPKVLYSKLVLKAYIEVCPSILFEGFHGFRTAGQGVEDLLLGSILRALRLLAALQEQTNQRCFWATGYHGQVGTGSIVRAETSS